MITIRVPKKTKRQQPANPLALGWHIMRQHPPSISGQRGHDVLYALCCKLARLELAEEAIWQIVRVYNDTNCEPPWSDDELQHKIDDALIHACEDPADASARRDQVRAAAMAKARSAKPVNDAFLEDDGRGHMVPKSPGRVVPVHTLPSTHPAQVYLRSRNFLAKDLFIQYRLAWCEAEREDVYYSRTEGGFRNTPQGRLVFYIEVNGVNVGWQARIPELEVDEHDGSQTKHYWHPYQQEWVAVSRRSDRATPWKYATPQPGYEGLEVRKYIIGAGARRNSCLMGFDEAMRWNNKFRRPGEPRVAVVTEGPLDAGRVGPPGIAMLGKFLSKDQAALLAARFDQVIYVAQNDESGQQAKGRVVEAMMAHPGVDLQLLNVPEMFKDMGEMSRPAARALVQQVCHLWMTATGYI